MIVVKATIVVKEGARDEVIALSKNCITETRKESGCIAYESFVATENDNTIVIVEEWTDIEALNAHMKTAHFMAFGESAKGFMAKPLEAKIFDAKEFKK